MSAFAQISGGRRHDGAIRDDNFPPLSQGGANVIFTNKLDRGLTVLPDRWGRRDRIG
jgi:hypothetical protein